MQRVAVELKLDPLDVIRRNLVPSGRFPYRTATGGLLDSGDYPAALRKRVGAGRLRGTARAAEGGARARPPLRHRPDRRGRAQRLQHGLHHDRAHAGRAPQGRSEERRAGDRDGFARSTRRACRCMSASVPQGQGHRTVVAQIVADALGLKPSDIRVIAEMDTARDAWSIASGNYSSRFAAAVVRRRASRGRADQGEACARGRGAAQRGGATTSNSPAGGRARRAIPTTPFRSAAGRRQPLGAGHGRRGRPSAARDRVLDAAATHRRRPRTTRSTRRSATASFSISAASRSTASPARCASTNT